jgi:hypothetical protein
MENGFFVSIARRARLTYDLTLIYDIAENDVKRVEVVIIGIDTVAVVNNDGVARRCESTAKDDLTRLTRANLRARFESVNDTLTNAVADIVIGVRLYIDLLTVLMKDIFGRNGCGKIILAEHEIVKLGSLSGY